MTRSPQFGARSRVLIGACASGPSYIEPEGDRSGPLPIEEGGADMATEINEMTELAYEGCAAAVDDDPRGRYPGTAVRGRVRTRDRTGRVGRDPGDDPRAAATRS